MKKYYLLLIPFLFACQPTETTPPPTQPVTAIVKDTIKADTVTVNTVTVQEVIPPVNDTLNGIANLISGIPDTSHLFSEITSDELYKKYSDNLNKRWEKFDTARIAKLKAFESSELSKQIAKETTLFYPFAGPDILHARLFFPNADKYVMFGLEQVGTFPDFQNTKSDSLKDYYSSVSQSLYAILQFSFFRTASMKSDLKKQELNGALHLLFLFIKRTGGDIVSARPMSLDSAGNKIYFSSFEVLKKKSLAVRGAEIKFITPDKKLKEVNFFSLNVHDKVLSKAFVKHMNSYPSFNSYLKGASYLLHESSFSGIRNIILDKSTSIVQDDSGVPVRYMLTHTTPRKFMLYGQYVKPISIFKQFHQPQLDSLYKNNEVRRLDFGLGYNYKDKNSTFMIVTKK